MGCGSSTPKNQNYPNSDYYNDNRYNRYDTQNIEPERQYRDLGKDDRRYNDTNNSWNDRDYQRQYEKSPVSELSNQMHSQLDNDSEDETPFDDDGTIDREAYTKNAMGLSTKARDFRTTILDEKPEKRPQITPGHLYIDNSFSIKDAFKKDGKNIEWKRPGDLTERPKLFTDGTTRFDIGQGAVGTCWLLAILADIAGNKDLMKQIIPENAYWIEDPKRYDGCCQFRFFIFGKWRDVFIDDRLPVTSDNQLYGARSASDRQEFWVALLEKAFAKIHGSYDAVYGGQPGDAFLLLTSGIGERIVLPENKQDENAGILFKRIQNALATGSYVTCTVLDKYDNYNGLVGGHAYSVLAVFVLKASNAWLLKLRNPWGMGEWKGPWSDGSPELKSIPQNSLSPVNKDDGEFYVCLSDFMKYFTQTTICSMTPDFDCDGIPDSLNYVLSIYGEWVGKTAAGFHNLLENQKFCFTVTEQGLVDKSYIPFVVQIVQQSKLGKTDHVPFRCDVFRVLADKIQPNCRYVAVQSLTKINNVYTPELQAVYRYKLSPGRYVIIASTAQKGQEKAFLLRLYTPAPLKNVNEIPATANVVCCESDSSIKIKGITQQLAFEKALFGKFVRGRNAGGEVSNRNSYQQNPQYCIKIPDTGSEVALQISIMQIREEPMCPLGIRLYKMDKDTRLPADIKFLYDRYENCVSHQGGSQSKFVMAWNIEVLYLLPPGRYLALIYLDKPNTEKSFSIVFRSTVHVGIKGYQTE